MIGIGHLDGLDASVAELSHMLADGDALEAAARLLLDDEGRDALLGPGGQGDDAGALTIGDPGLRPVQDVLVAVAFGPARDVASVAAGVRLRQRQRATPLAGGHGGEPTLLLLLGPVSEDQCGHHRVGVHDAGEAHPAVGELFDDPDVGQQVEAQTAVLLGDRDAEQPEVAHLTDDLFREGVGPLEGGGCRDHLALDELADRPDDLGPNGLVDVGGPRAGQLRPPSSRR